MKILSKKPSAENEFSFIGQYADAYHQIESIKEEIAVEEEKRMKLVAENEDLQKRMQESKESFEKFHVENKVKIKEQESALKIEEERIKAMRIDVEKNLAENRNFFTEIEARESELLKKEHDVKRAEFQVRAQEDEVAKKMKSLQERESAVEKREAAVVDSENDWKSRLTNVFTMEDSARVKEEELKVAKRETEKAAADIRFLSAQLNERGMELERKQADLQDLERRIKEKEVALKPVLGIYNEFREKLVAAGEDSEAKKRVIEWLDSKVTIS